MSYNFRSTSYTGSKLDAELRKRGAATFGDQTRKQTRLQRFMNTEENREEKLDRLQIVIENEQRKVMTRAEVRAAELRGSHLFFDENGYIVNRR